MRSHSANDRLLRIFADDAADACFELIGAHRSKFLALLHCAVSCVGVCVAAAAGVDWTGAVGGCECRSHGIHDAIAPMIEMDAAMQATRITCRWCRSLCS